MDVTVTVPPYVETAARVILPDAVSAVGIPSEMVSVVPAVQVMLEGAVVPPMVIPPLPELILPNINTPEPATEAFMVTGLDSAALVSILPDGPKVISVAVMLML